MHKARHFPLDLPRSVRKTVAENLPLLGAIHESSNEWLQHLSYHLYTVHTFSFLFQNSSLLLPCLTQKFTKRCTKGLDKISVFR